MILAFFYIIDYLIWWEVALSVPSVACNYDILVSISLWMIYIDVKIGIVIIVNCELGDQRVFTKL